MQQAASSRREAERAEAKAREARESSRQRKVARLGPPGPSSSARPSAASMRLQGLGMGLKGLPTPTPPPRAPPLIPAPTASVPARTIRAVIGQLRQMQAVHGSGSDQSQIPRGTPRGGGEGADFTVSLPDEANAMRWRVEMGVPTGCALGDAIRDHAARHHVRPTVELEVSFGASYPSAPPFVRVVAPRFAFHTGHVTIGGSICMELLTSTGWSAEYTIEALLVTVRQAMLDGNGSLDPERAHVPYDEAEARQAFERVARQHGWKP